MGMTQVKVTLEKSRERRKDRMVDMLAHSGAVYSLIDARVLRSLGRKPYRERDFFLAEGSKTSRPIGDAYFEYRGVGGPAPVVCGGSGGENLLGVTTLEALELLLDPLKRELRPMTMPPTGAALGTPRAASGVGPAVRSNV